MQCGHTKENTLSLTPALSCQRTDPALHRQMAIWRSSPGPPAHNYWFLWLEVGTLRISTVTISHGRLANTGCKEAGLQAGDFVIWRFT